ncbi:serine protease [Vibrio fluvialis]|nr:serine protease [Vibrio fluvialis]
MKKWKALAALTYSLSAIPSFAATTDVTTYIVNGTSTSVSTYGSFVSLFYDRIEYDGVYGVGSYCGGTMLDATHVLTAAHCIFDGSGNLDEDYMLFTVVGQTDDESAFPNGSIETVRASEFYYHPDYEDSSTNLWPNDIAIIKLESSLNVVDYTDIPSDDSYRLGTNGTDDDTNDNVFEAVGHGNTSTGVDNTNDLLVTDMTYVSNTTCQLDLPSLTSKQICFKGDYSVSTGLDNGTCQGDSGGPIYRNVSGSLTQVGIVSFGPTTCGTGWTNSDADAVFTEVYDYTSWINSVLAGTETPAFTATDAKRLAYLGLSSTSSDSGGGGSLGLAGFASLLALGLWRTRKRISSEH